MARVWVISVVWIALAGLSSLAILADVVAGHRQRMWIMNVVWVTTALWAGPLGLWAYARWGHGPRRPRFPVQVAKGTTHCGSGCTLGDLCAEWIVLALPLSVGGHRLFGAWIYDYVLAFAFGIAFQYFTIKPMRKLSRRDGIKAALKADALSLTAWQVGMYGWMALATFLIFGHELHQTSPVFWFMMQIGMMLGFLTSYPVNWWLIRRGIKEAM